MRLSQLLRFTSSRSQGDKKITMELPRQRQAAYRLFSSLCLYPNEERIAALSLAAEELVQGVEWWADTPCADTWDRLWNTVLQIGVGSAVPLEEEYTRLFLVNAAAPPYESFYMDQQGHARGLISVQVGREYEEIGLVPSPSMKEPPDHLALELDFMSFLCDLEAQAYESGDTELATDVLKRQSRFLNQRLGRWVPAFTSQVQRAEADRLYGKVANAIDAFVRHELATPASHLSQQGHETIFTLDK